MILLLIILLPSVYAVEVSISELFNVEKDVVDSGKEIYFYTGQRLIGSFDGDLSYQYNDRLSSDLESKTLPFGEPINTESRFSFTGKELDGDLYYFNARYYDSSLGRFNSVDPLLETPYQYVGSNPLNLIDPTGESEKKPLLLHLEVNPVYDWNDAFCWQYLDPSLFEEYQIVKRTINNRGDFFHVIKEVSEEFGPIDLLVYGFHGFANGIHVSHRYLVDGRDESGMFTFSYDDINSYLTSEDLMKLGPNSMREYFSEGASCIGYSCSNGAESEWSDYPNFQDSMAYALGIPSNNLLRPEITLIRRGEEGRVELGVTSYRIVFFTGSEDVSSLKVHRTPSYRLKYKLGMLREQYPSVDNFYVFDDSDEVSSWAYPGQNIVNALSQMRL